LEHDLVTPLRVPHNAIRRIREANISLRERGGDQGTVGFESKGPPGLVISTRSENTSIIAHNVRGKILMYQCVCDQLADGNGGSSVPIFEEPFPKLILGQQIPMKSINPATQWHILSVQGILSTF
jgi:hypothetical protein